MEKLYSLKFTTIRAIIIRVSGVQISPPLPFFFYIKHDDTSLVVRYERF